MVTDNQTNSVWYIQTGKTGTAVLHGFVKKDEVLAIDTNILKKDGATYTGGSLLLLNGPLDLEKYKITITNGAAQLVPSSHVQEFLDYNVAVKFARGDLKKDGSGFTYKPWALQKDQIWTLGYTYHPLKLTAATDNYPR
jgi:hypothetical protein